ncbi:MAG: DivIVA domain-containing protein [Oscillospiraceae bacterium]|nr:DivIVA domain-containing protein [Oscillospiraceae bacterium]
MAESRFIKTVINGGYDRTEVNKKMEYLYNEVYDLRNQQRENKLLLEDYKKGTPEEKAFENVLNTEKAKLTEMQVKNEAANTKIKTLTDENKQLSDDIAQLRKEIEDLTAQLGEANDKIKALEAGSDPMAISQVFVEAQKSSNLLKASAQAEADKIKKDSDELAESIITDANNTASKIIYDAEKTAAVTIADAQNKSNEMDAASNNLKAAALSEVNDLLERLLNLKSAVDDFNTKGVPALSSSEKLLKDTKKTLESGGVPVFKEPKKVEPDLPDIPEIKDIKPAKAKKKLDLNGLDELAQLADNFFKGDKAGDGAAADSKSLESDLDALTKQAEALNS